METSPDSEPSSLWLGYSLGSFFSSLSDQALTEVEEEMTLTSSKAMSRAFLFECAKGGPVEIARVTVSPLLWSSLSLFTKVRDEYRMRILTLNKVVAWKLS